MIKMDAAAAAKKWAQNLSAATQQIKDGVQRVTVSPTEKAAARADAYVAGVQRSVQDGTWQEGLRRVTLGMWQQAMISKGLNRIGPGAQAALPKFTDFLRQFLAYEASVLAQLESQPRGSLDQNIQRAVTVMRANAQFRKGTAQAYQS